MHCFKICISQMKYEDLVLVLFVGIENLKLSYTVFGPT